MRHSTAEPLRHPSCWRFWRSTRHWGRRCPETIRP